MTKAWFTKHGIDFVQYVRDENNQKIGLMLVGKTPAGPKMGWSFLAPQDTWSEDMARTIALGRFYCARHTFPVHPKWEDTVESFGKRVDKYYGIAR